MNLLLYWLCNSYSVSAFAKATIGILIFFIALNIACCFITPAFAIDMVIDLIILIVFWLLGFPINAILITFLVWYAIGSVLQFLVENPIGGIINVIIEILNIVGFCLFHANLI